jgi:hypothetical protein
MNFRIPKSDILFSLPFPLHNKSNDFYFKYNYLEIGILNISDLIVQYYVCNVDYFNSLFMSLLFL